jgi:mycofactocin precursor
MDATEPTTRLDPPNDPATRAGTDAEPRTEGDLVEEDLVEEISIDGMCGVY